jgi:V/A-type H+/Na+-transporting ATPase subunit G/H
MEEIEILKEIREAESEANEIIAKAQEESNKISQSARKEAQNVYNEKIQSALKDQSSALEAYKSESTDLRRKKLIESNKKVNDLQKTTKKNVDKAVEFVLKKFEESI